MMFEASINEFPFVGELPKREKSKLGKALDVVKEFTELSEQYGTLIPLGLIVPMMGISRQRLIECINDGQLAGVSFHGLWYVPESALIAFAKRERRTGRPPKAQAPTMDDCLEVARELLGRFKNSSK